MAFPLIAAGASIIGGILGAIGGKGKPIDPEVLKRLFGPEAINEETMKLFNMISTSPYGQNLIRQASMAGGNISQNITKRLTAAGLAGGGAETGVGSFAAAAGQEAGGLLESQARSSIYSNALEAALQNVRDRMSAYTNSQLAEQGKPSTLAQIGGALQGAAGVALAGYSPEAKAVAEGPPAGGASSYVPDFSNTNKLGYRRKPMFGSTGPSLSTGLSSVLSRNGGSGGYRF